MRTVAVIAVRNEMAYMANCLQYLADNGIDYAVIDNESDDGTAELVQSDRFAPHLAAFETLPYEGTYDWTALLKAKQRLYETLDADWLMHLDADELVHSYRPDERLDEAIARIAATGADALDFDEFVFLPIDAPYRPDRPGLPPPVHYYLYAPGKHRKVNAWRADLKVDKVSSGGHRIDGVDYNLADETFALRHYIFVDQEHAYLKYTRRAFAEAETRRGWHRNRVGIEARRFAFPPAGRLQRLEHPGSRELRRDQPRKRHYWERDAAPAAKGSLRSLFGRARRRLRTLET